MIGCATIDVHGRDGNANQLTVTLHETRDEAVASLRSCYTFDYLDDGSGMLDADSQDDLDALSDAEFLDLLEVDGVRVAFSDDGIAV